MKRLPPILACVLALAACTDHEAQRQAAQAAQAQAREQQADEVARQYDSAVQAQDWERARVHGAALLDQYAGTAAAQRIAPGYAEVKAKGEAAREQRRLQGLWQYSQVPEKGGSQRSALIYGKERVDVDGSGPSQVRLVFRDHPAWGRSAYLVLEKGDFAKACYGHCSVTVAVDGGKARPMAANRPDTREAIAMFIDDDKALWKLARQARALTIAFPVKAGGTRSVVFETGGLDPAQMPGWK
ncbi:hypothetical protein [Xanthomonas massiliensis]|uniref:hypothetical protein n=1 Tax=Xanthomonas massiliensis TaxID=1720302 RepID=UPI0008264B85|nr:hypothetical protein [Xanthomonas massiliensis]